VKDSVGTNVSTEVSVDLQVSQDATGSATVLTTLGLICLIIQTTFTEKITSCVVFIKLT
jgi:hypothetical protein